MLKFATISTALIAMTALAFGGDPKADPKAAPAKADPKGAPAAPAPTGKDAGGGMPEMKPPAELAAMAKSMAGTWTCKGQGMGHDMKMTDMTATMKSNLEMGGYWIHETFDAKMGKEPFHFEAYTKYDAKEKKLDRVMVEQGGGWSSGEAAMTNCGAAPNGCKMDFELQSHGPMGDFPFKDHVDATDLKAGVKAWGEFTMDKGKTWTKVYEMTCKK
jgi:hypothetical protein